MLIDGDTVVVITPEQVKRSNIIYVERNNYKELSYSLESTLDVCLENNSTKTLEIQSKNKQIAYQDSIIINDTIMIQELTDIKTTLEGNLKAEKRKTKFLGFTSGGAGVVIIILSLLLIL